jgi:hypothetical protein
MISASRRKAKFAARMQSSQLDPTLAAVSANAVANYGAYLEDFYPNQVSLRTILNAAGIQPIWFGAYEAFHGELYHLYKVCAGPALDAACAVLVDKWSDSAHLGAAAATVLSQIATDIYHITTPGTP